MRCRSTSRSDHRSGYSRQLHHQRPALRSAGHGAWRRHRPALSPRPFELGNILALTRETGQYVQQIFELFDAPDIKKSFDANTKWDVIEAVANRHLGGATEMWNAPRWPMRGADPAIHRRERFRHDDHAGGVRRGRQEDGRAGRRMAGGLPADTRRAALPRPRRRSCALVIWAEPQHRVANSRLNRSPGLKGVCDGPPTCSCGAFRGQAAEHRHRRPAGAVADGAACDGNAFAISAVWLPRGFYTLLDNDEYYRRRPDQMGGGWLAPGTRDAILRELTLELEPWRRAWQNGRLSSRVHWIGDAQYERAARARGNSPVTAL